MNARARWAFCRRQSALWVKPSVNVANLGFAQIALGN